MINYEKASSKTTVVFLLMAFFWIIKNAKIVKKHVIEIKEDSSLMEQNRS